MGDVKRPREYGLADLPDGSVITLPDGRRLRVTLTPDAGPGVVRAVVELADVARQYLAATEARDKASTRRAKRAVLERDVLPLLGTMPIEAVDRNVLRGLQAHLRKRCAPGTVNARMAVVHAVLHWAAEELRVLPAAPKIPPLRHETVPRTVDRSDYEALLRSSLRPWMRATVLLCGDAGLRIGEAIALQWECVRGDEGLCVCRNSWERQIGPPKSGKRRIVPMTARLRLHLDGMARESALVLGRLRLSCTILSHLYGACDRARVPRMTMHGMRHSFASELQRRGVPLQVVRDLLGHSSVAVTDAYLHATHGDAVAAIGRLDR